MVEKSASMLAVETSMGQYSRDAESFLSSVMADSEEVIELSALFGTCSREVIKRNNLLTQMNMTMFTLLCSDAFSLSGLFALRHD